MLQDALVTGACIIPMSILNQYCWRPGNEAWNEAWNEAGIDRDQKY